MVIDLSAFEAFLFDLDGVITRTAELHADGILSQFEGYEALEEFDWAGYRQRYGDLYRLDFILEAEWPPRFAS